MNDRKYWWQLASKAPWLIGTIKRKYVKPTQNNPCVEYGIKYKYCFMEKYQLNKHINIYKYCENNKNEVKPSDQLQRYQKTWEGCQALCAKTPECKFWTWYGLQNVQMWKYNSVKTMCGMGRSKSNPSYHNAYKQNWYAMDYAISGPKYCPKVKFCAKAKQPVYFTLITIISNKFLHISFVGHKSNYS